MEDNNHVDQHDDVTTNAANNNNHGWQKVTSKRQRKPIQAKPTAVNQAANHFPKLGANGSDVGVFTSLEKKSEERRKLIQAQNAAIAASYETVPVRSARNIYSDDDDDSDAAAEAVPNGGGVEEKKVKPKKVKKPKVTVAEAAAKIDAADLSAFIADVTASYETQQDIQLMRFADYFGRAFSSVSAAQFPYAKLFRESPIAKIADTPISHIPEPVYKTSVDWINQRSVEALGSFVLWSLDSILPGFTIQQAGAKGSKKGTQQVSSKSQVAMFVVLAMVLRRKPDVLISLLPTLRENSKYQGQDKLALIVWMIAQAGQGDLAVGLYSWAHHILLILGGKGGSNPQSRDLALQLVERILAAPKARTILVNGAVRKGERLIPPSALDFLLRATFPSSARVKATERFEAVYPTLKEVALAGSPGSKAMKQVSQQILTNALKAAGEGIAELSNEASSIAVWSFTQSSDCYKLWEKLYLDNIEASVAILRKLTQEWNELSVKLASLEVLGETLRNFRHKNEKVLTEGEKSARQTLFREADKYCKVLLGRLSRGHGCLKGMAFVLVAVGVGVALMSPSMESLDWNKLDWNKLSVMFNAQQSF